MIRAETYRMDSIFQINNHNLFEIPVYQRGYSWSTDAVGQFLDDLKDSNERKGYTHFFGTIYTVTDNSTIRIVDGQQRITTCAMFLICARNYFHTLKESIPLAKRIHHDLQRMLYKIDDETHMPNIDEFILSLGRINHKFFKKHILPVSPISPKSNIMDSANNDSDECLAKAYAKISKFIYDLVGLDESRDDKIGVKQLYDIVMNLLQNYDMIRVEVEDESQAYDMFNLINNRGMKLDSSDLIKNRIFSKLYDQFKDKNKQNLDKKLDSYDKTWSDIRNRITDRDQGNYDLDIFFYNYLIAFESKESDLKFGDVFKKFQDLLKDKRANDIINALDEWSIKFTKLRNPQPHFNKYPVLEHYLKKIKDINATHIYSIILFGYKKFWNRDNESSNKDKKLFEDLVEISYKYHLRVKSLPSGISTTTYQNKLYCCISKMMTGELESKDSIINELTKEDAYPNNDKISLILKTFKVKNKNLALACLEEIERTYNLKPINSDVSIEHIMPKNITRWKNYIKEQHNYSGPNADDDVKNMHLKYRDWLANQTLLNLPINERISNGPFNGEDAKKANYKEDYYEITRSLEEYPEWNSTNIEERQKIFAEKLLDILDITKLHT